MKNKFKNYKETETHYADMLKKVREQIMGQIIHIISDLFDGRICVRYYHDGEPDLEINTFFEVDDNGYGRELFVDTIYTNEESGEIEITMHDSEDVYCPYWNLSDFNSSNALYLLSELEDIVNYIAEENCKIVKDWEPYND